MVFAFVWASPSFAQQAPWVDQLQSKHGQLCCSNNDGRRLDDPEWDTLGKVQTDYNGNSGFRVYEDSRWYDVPNYAMVTVRNRDGIARVWWDREYNAEGGTITKRVRCFIAGELG
jgi:hypothetical protein